MSKLILLVTDVPSTKYVGAIKRGLGKRDFDEVVSKEALAALTEGDYGAVLVPFTQDTHGRSLTGDIRDHFDVSIISYGPVVLSDPECDEKIHMIRNSDVKLMLDTALDEVI